MLGKSGGEAAFIRLMELAREDAGTRKKILAVLSLEPFDRESAINTLLDHMRKAGASGEFMGAFAVLLDHEAAQKALNILRDAQEDGSA